jgi:hypothetical protein
MGGGLALRRWLGSATAPVVASAILVASPPAPQARAVSGADGCPAGAARQWYGRGDTGVLDVTNTPGLSETEPSISVDPADQERLIIGSNRWQPLLPGVPLAGADGVVDTDVYSTADGGCQWSGGRLSSDGLGSFGNPVSSLAPWLPVEFDDVGNTITADQNSVFNLQGESFYQDVGLDLSALDITVPVWRSGDGGRSWSVPVKAFSELKTLIQIDRPWLAVDDSAGRRSGTLYLTWETMFYQPYLPEVYERSSTDAGRSWGPVVRVDQGVQRTQWDPRQYPAVGAGGVLYDVYDVAPLQPIVGPQLEPIRLVLASSSDGGRTFSHFTVDANVQRPADPDEAEPYFTELISALAADPRHPGRVAVAWPQAVGSAGSRIMLRYTLDGGRRWSPRIEVASSGLPDQQDHVALNYLPNGRLAVGFRDRRCCGGGWADEFEVMARAFQVSRTGRLYGGRTLQFTDGPQVPITQYRGGVAPDEYLGMTASHAGVAMDWSQLGAGRLPDIFYRRIPLAAFRSTSRRHPPQRAL